CIVPQRWRDVGKVTACQLGQQLGACLICQPVLPGYGRLASVKVRVCQRKLVRLQVPEIDPILVYSVVDTLQIQSLRIRARHLEADRLEWADYGHEPEKYGEYPGS